MIAAMLMASAATIAVPFAPPLGANLRYRTVDTRPMHQGGEVRATLDQTLRFTRADDATEATLLATRHAVEAPAPFRAAFDLLFAGFDGVALTVRMDRDGAIASVIGGAASWAAVRAAQEAMVARIAADPAVAAPEKARIRALSAGTFDLDPAARDARLAESFAALLAPPLPALALGETRAFRTEVRGPRGPLASGGAATLVRADGDRLDYRIETRSDPGATDPVVAALLAAIAPGASPAARAQADAAAATLAGAVFLERTELTIERATGLLLRAHTERTMQDATGAVHPVQTSDLARLP